ncbi:TSSK6-activating co-chaperone protein [Suncus etruscus]|uniref:TSSK6-activating co-chaperone protein n=1 Tax=Suncus etruscus TaxID=109475 RepID=UPI0021109E22|nr:TSSK6-activating co-chaperone protein [Suncus etruscus]
MAARCRAGGGRSRPRAAGFPSAQAPGLGQLGPPPTARVFGLQGWVAGFEALEEQPGTTSIGVQMEQHTTTMNRKANEDSDAIPLCPAKPSPSFINLQANAPPATFLNMHATQLPSRNDSKPRECLGLLECMYANLQLQTQLAQQQLAILETLQASLAQLAPGKESKNADLPALTRSLLLRHLPQFSK